MAKVNAALEWARRGFRVFPLYPDEPGTPNNNKRAKEPVWKGWTDWATDDPDRIRQWWTGTEYNVGVLTTGLMGIDLDTKDGRPGLQSWMDLDGAFDTLAVRTASGGLHLYYGDANVSNDQSRLGAGIDVRGHNGYLIAPGSTIEGVPYTIEIDAPVQPAPAHLVALCRRPGEKAENRAAVLVEEDTPRAVALAMDRIARTPGAVAGTQSDAAYSLACQVRDVGVGEAMAGVLLDAWAARCTPAIGPDDLRYRIANAYQFAQNPAGLKNPEAQFSAITVLPLPVVVPAVEQVAATWGNLLPLSVLRPRDWVLHRMLLVGEVTMLLATGGVGKSTLQLYIAICLALGRDFLDHKNYTGGPRKVVIHNAEDDIEELSRRVYAQCNAMHVDPADVAPYLMLRSGRVRIVEADGNVNMEFATEYMNLLAAEDVVAVFFDPLNKTHAVNANDNIAMNQVMDAYAQLAKQARVAVMISHHTSKPGQNAVAAGNAFSSQGASAVVDSSRLVFTMSGADDNDALRYGLLPHERPYFVRLDDAKMNRTVASNEPQWLHRQGVNVAGEPVGALLPAHMHDREKQSVGLMIATLHQALIDSSENNPTVKRAVDLLKNGQSMMAKLTKGQIEQKLVNGLQEPFTMSDGSQVVMREGRIFLE